jgi:hypothetical protein
MVVTERPPFADASGKQSVAQVTSSIAEDFSITRGGLLHWVLVRLGQAGDGRRLVLRRALAVVLITWLPLLILSVVGGVAWGRQIKIPFLRDLAINVRLLIAAPILILSESRIDRRWRNLVLEFLRTELVNGEVLPSFEKVLERTARWRDSVVPETVLALIAFIPSLFIVKTELLMSGNSSWHTLNTGAVSAAGWWFNLVSTPVFRFLLLRWVWRMLLWTSFLWSVSRIRLYLVATHTDLAAGLGFLSEGQKAFSPIVFAGGEP